MDDETPYDDGVDDDGATHSKSAAAEQAQGQEVDARGASTALNVDHDHAVILAL